MNGIFQGCIQSSAKLIADEMSWIDFHVRFNIRVQDVACDVIL